MDAVFFAAVPADGRAFFCLLPDDFRLAVAALFATFIPLLAPMRHGKRLARALISQVGETEAVMPRQHFPLLVQPLLVGDRLR